jgi:hypothetical protein
MSEKLAAVVADKQQPQPQQQRYASLRLVNLEWIKTSCRAGTKAQEAGFMPDITSELVCSSVSSQQHSDFLIIHNHQAAAQQHFGMVCSRPQQHFGMVCSRPQQHFGMVCSRPQQNFIKSLFVLIAAAHNPHPRLQTVSLLSSSFVGAPLFAGIKPFNGNLAGSSSTPSVKATGPSTAAACVSTAVTSKKQHNICN